MRYCPICKQDFHLDNHIEVTHGNANYVRHKDDVWSCSGCGADVTARYPNEGTCPNCGRRIS